MEKKEKAFLIDQRIRRMMIENALLIYIQTRDKIYDLTSREPSVDNPEPSNQVGKMIVDLFKGDENLSEWFFEGYVAGVKRIDKNHIEVRSADGLHYMEIWPQIDIDTEYVFAHPIFKACCQCSMQKLLKLSEKPIDKIKKDLEINEY